MAVGAGGGYSCGCCCSNNTPCWAAKEKKERTRFFKIQIIFFFDLTVDDMQGPKARSGSHQSLPGGREFLTISTNSLAEQQA